MNKLLLAIPLPFLAFGVARIGLFGHNTQRIRGNHQDYEKALKITHHIFYDEYSFLLDDHYIETTNIFGMKDSGDMEGISIRPFRLMVGGRIIKPIIITD